MDEAERLALAGAVLDHGGHRGGRIGFGHWKVPPAVRGSGPEARLRSDLCLLHQRIVEHDGMAFASNETHPDCHLQARVLRRKSLAERLAPPPADPDMMIAEAMLLIAEEERALSQLNRDLQQAPLQPVDVTRVEEKYGVALFQHSPPYEDRCGRWSAHGCVEFQQMRVQFEATVDALVRTCVAHLHNCCADDHVARDVVRYVSGAVFDGVQPAFAACGSSRATWHKRGQTHFEEQMRVVASMHANQYYGTNSSISAARSQISASLRAFEGGCARERVEAYAGLARLQRRMPRLTDNLMAIPGALQFDEVAGVDAEVDHVAVYVTTRSVDIAHVLRDSLHRLEDLAAQRAAAHFPRRQCVLERGGEALPGSSTLLAAIQVLGVDSRSFRTTVPALQVRLAPDEFLETPNTTAFSVAVQLRELDVVQALSAPGALLGRVVARSLGALAQLRPKIEGVALRPAEADASLPPPPSTSRASPAASSTVRSTPRSNISSGGTPVGVPPTLLDTHRSVALHVAAALRPEGTAFAPSQMHEAVEPASCNVSGVVCVDLTQARNCYMAHESSRQVANHRLADLMQAVARSCAPGAVATAVHSKHQSKNRLSGFVYSAPERPDESLCELRGLVETSAPTLVVACSNTRSRLCQAAVALAADNKQLRSILPRRRSKK